MQQCAPSCGAAVRTIVWCSSAHHRHTELEQCIPSVCCTVFDSMLFLIKFMSLLYNYTGYNAPRMPALVPCVLFILCSLCHISKFNSIPARGMSLVCRANFYAYTYITFLLNYFIVHVLVILLCLRCLGLSCCIIKFTDFRCQIIYRILSLFPVVLSEIYRLLQLYR